MAGQKSLIFLAGGWHSAAHVEPLIPHLHDLRLVPIQLETSKGPATIEDNVSALLAVMETEANAGYEICLLGHSAAGDTVIEAAARFVATEIPEKQSKLRAILFLATFAVCGPSPRAPDQAWARYDPTTGQVRIVKPAGELFYGDLTPAEAHPFVEALTVCYPCQKTPAYMSLRWDEIKGRIPTLAYFKCLRDKAVSLEWQETEANALGIEVFGLDTGHCPMVDRPAVLADAIRRSIQAQPSPS